MRQRATIGRLNEQTFNVVLGEALRRVNARWRENEACVAVERQGAQRGSRKRPDIVVDDKHTPRIAIECAFGGDGDKDALARLDNDGFKAAVAIAVPTALRDMNENEVAHALASGQMLDYAVLQSDFRFPSQGYITGTVRDLAGIIPVAAVTERSVEDTANKVATLIDQAADALQDGMSPRDCERIADVVYQRSALTGFRTVLVLWFDAMLVQAHLRTQGRVEVDPLPLSTDDVPPMTLTRTWRQIMATNWHSIFAPAVDVLERSFRENRRATSQAIRLLLEAVEVVESACLGDVVNIGAELFPRISEDRKTAAAFYTTPATAELLSALTIRADDHHQWGSKELFQHLRVADLACGTGTLVRAAYRRVRVLHDANGGDSESQRTIHKDAMEKGIKAADVSPIAAHLTNSSMAIMGRGDPYNRTNIGWVGVGALVPNSKGHRTTGSLEFLKEDDIYDMFDDFGGVTSGKEAERRPIAVSDGELDYVLMNPPYSRTRGGQSAFDIAGMTPAERDGCQLRWGALLRGESAIRTAGMAASFLCVARKKVKPGGRIGFVLPLTAAFGKAWSSTRRMIVRDFDDVVAVARAGGKGGREALSADTQMGEMLLVATRRKTAGKPCSVKCVTLHRMSTRHGEAGEFARSIQNALSNMRGHSRPVTAGADELGQIAELRVKDGEPWSHLGVQHADLAVSALNITSNGVLIDITDGGDEMPFPCPMTTVGALFDVGPTHDLLGYPTGGDGRGAFEFHPITRRADIQGTNRSLWSADAQFQAKLVVDPTHKGEVSNAEKARRIKNRTGTLHYARGMRWTSQALLAATTENRIFGGRGWTTLTHTDASVCRAFALWANSTLGLVTHWTQGGRTHIGRATTQVKAIQAMPCPDLSVVSPQNLRIAADTFDQIADHSMLPACQAHVDSTREQIDLAVIALLDLPKKRGHAAIAALRELWCIEPSVHGDNAAALRLLAEHGLVDNPS